MAGEIRIDALIPAEMATRAEYLGVRKAETPWAKTLLLAVLAGAFISLGAMFATVVSAGQFTVRDPAGAAVYTATLPYGIQRLAAGIVFCLGLVLVVVGGAELFTGNTLLVMAWASGKTTTGAVLRNWAVVYAGNLAGAVATAAMVYAAGQHRFGGGAVGVAALDMARAKCSLGFGQALVLGILCNALVCLAVWLTFSARSTVDRVVAVIFPVAAFVAGGFEHSVANMYFVPYGILLRGGADGEFWKAAGRAPGDYAPVDWGGFLAGNLLPVTLGNIVGGAVLVAATYWIVFLRRGAADREGSA